MAALNAIGWIIFGAALIVAGASLAGLYFVFRTPPQTAEAVKLERALNDTYTDVVPSWSYGFLFLCLLALAFVVGCLGYSQTHTYRKQITRISLEQKSE
jgi:hypothetical protein